jgi:hypothetical protein
MRAKYGFVAVLTEGHEYIKTLLASCTDKVIGRHLLIVPESGPIKEEAAASLW